MSTSMDSLPLILRNEPFGGILFEPSDATMVELDNDAFNLASSFLKDNHLSLNEEEKKMIEQIRPLIDFSVDRSVKTINNQPFSEHEAGLSVFSAPTLVDFQITRRCLMECPHCYASSSPHGEHTPIGDIEMALNQIGECGVCQIAIGGGEPLLHPHLKRVLELCHHNGIVPNLTTNGLHLNDANLALLKEYCGAVALSLEGVGKNFGRWRKSGFEHFKQSLHRLIEYGLLTVIQVTLSSDNLNALDEIVEFCLGHPKLYGVIFLAYKPVGRGKAFNKPLAELSPKKVYTGLKSAFYKLSQVMRVGYDCCLTPGIAGIDAEFDFKAGDHLEGCSACRSSIGISADLDVIPCTFLPQERLGNLREESLTDIWRNRHSDYFRCLIESTSKNNKACRTCQQLDFCLGGCPAMKLVNCYQDYTRFLC